MSSILNADQNDDWSKGEKIILIMSKLETKFLLLENTRMHGCVYMYMYMFIQILGCMYELMYAHRHTQVPAFKNKKMKKNAYLFLLFLYREFSNFANRLPAFRSPFVSKDFDNFTRPTKK